MLVLTFLLPLILAGIQTAHADQTLVRNESVQLNVGDSLVIHSSRLAIQQVFLEGNLSSATIEKPAQYPADNLQLTTSTPGTYELRVVFNQSSGYNVDLIVRQNATNAIENSTSYYVSGGSLELDVTANFSQNLTASALQTGPTSASPWDSFANWMGDFGRAFPDWVKALYLILGVQFMCVGGLWIRRESARKEGSAQVLDAGEKGYLWVDVIYKFLLASFVAIVLIMGGELVLLFILRFMFLVSLDLLSLWDLFVIGFALGAVIFVYLVRLVLEKGLDLKPFESE
jgi:hypothetical protein